MPLEIKIPPSVAAKLGYYVYVYVDPSDESVFYVGKGKGSRAVAHIDSSRIRRSKAAPRVDILAHGLPDERTALAVEMAAIDLIGIRNLANMVRGHGGRQYGRTPLAQLVAQYTKRKAEIKVPAILIRINKLYRFGMTPAELYDATRASWKVGPKKDKARYALAVYDGVVREAYSITGWLPGGTTFAAQNDGREARRPDRWEFVGTLADDRARKRYVNTYVGHLFPPGAQNPITYVNINE